MSGNADRLREAFESRQLDWLIDMMDPGVTWRGIQLPGEEVPICHDRDEVRNVMTEAIARGWICAMEIRGTKVWRPAFFVLAAAVSFSLVGCAPAPEPSSASRDGCGPGMCPVALRTSSSPAGPNEPCPLMAIIGVLAPEPTYGLGLRNEGGRIVGVIWPFGYSARRDEAGTILLDRLGRALAREGDTVQMGGWINFREHVAHPCASPELEVIAPAAGSGLATPGS